jgi:large repetitive protein
LWKHNKFYSPNGYRMKKIILCLIVLSCFSLIARAQVKPALGTAASFTVLAGVGVNNAGNTGVDGNLGTSPGNTLVGFPPGIIQGTTHRANATAATAQSDLNLAYNAAAGQSFTQNLSGQNLGGKTLKPGVYKLDGAANLTGNLILDSDGNPDAVFIFQISGNFTAAASAQVNFLETAKPRVNNIFWQVGGSVSIGASSAFRGTILANQNISMLTGATIQGRLLSRTGTVTLTNNIIKLPTDLAVTKTKSPGLKFSVGDNITFTITARNLGPLDRNNIRVSDILPPGLTYVSSSATTSSYNPATSLWLINLASGATETLTLVTRINSSSSDLILNNATIASDDFDEIIENNSATVDICVAPADPGAIAGPASVCVNSVNNTFSITPVEGARSYNWTVPSGWTITGGQNTAAITVTAGSLGGQITVTAVNVCAVSAISRKDIQASLTPPATPGPITGNPASVNVCANQANNTYTIEPVANATSYAWEVPTGWTIVSGQGTTAITVTAGTAAGNISVKAVNGCAPSAARALAVTTSTAPPVPPAAITGNAAPCIGVSATYTVSGGNAVNSYSWTAPAGWTITGGQGTNTITVIAGATAGNMTVTAANGCGVSTATTLAVKSFTNTPPGNISGPAAPCGASAGNSYSVEAATGTTSYTWTVPNGWTITEGQGTPAIKVTAGSNAGNITVTAFNDCGASASRTLAVAPLAKPENPAAITSTTTQPCSGQSNLTYTIPAVNGTTSYNWSVPAGWTIVSGQSTTSITVTAGSSSGNVSVVAVNNCGTSEPITQAVTPSTTAPTEPLRITGKDNPCLGEANVTYSVAVVTGALGYTWTVPAGWQIISGQGSTTINVTTGSGSGEIKVAATNNCGSSNSASLNVLASTAPSPAPGAITGSQLQPCSGETNLTYSISPVNRATSYNWTVPNGWTIISGQGTTAISVTAGSTAGKISVAAVNGCGTSAASELTVNPVTAVPVAPLAITGTAVPCAGQNSLVYTIAGVANATSYVWTVPTGWSIVSGQNTTSITVMAGTQPGEIGVTAQNNCGSSTAKTLAVNVSSVLPVVPASITGNTNLCAAQTGVTYSVAPVSNAISYTWTVPAGWNIASGQGTNAIVVSAGNNPGVISVKANNNCGTSAAREITVAPTNGAPAAPGAITSSSSATCSGQTGITFAVEPVAGATTYNWTVPTGWNITAGQGTPTITVTAGNTPGNITLTAFNNCGASTATVLAVSPGAIAPAPVSITGNAIPCGGSTGNNYSIVAVPGAVSYVWTVPADWTITAGAGTTTITVVAGASKGAVTVAAVNDCGTSVAASLNVNPGTAVPGAPGIITGSNNVCAAVANLTYSISSVENASKYIWSVPTGWVITAGQGTTTITVTASNSPGTISVISENGCGIGTGSILPVAVTGSAPPVPVAITGTTEHCAGETDIQYSIAAVNGATTYTWTLPADWTIISGQGTTAIKVKIGSTSGEVKVASGNGCGLSTAQILAVKVNNAPAKPQNISGPTALCAGNTAIIYRINRVTTGPDAVSFTWTVPSDWTIVAGQGTNAITVTVGKASGTVSVVGNNPCGSSVASTLAVTSSTTPSPAPGRIRTTQLLACIGQTNISYTIDPVPTSTSYTWVVPADWVITDGQGTTSIMVTAGENAGSISVKAINGCGESDASSLGVFPSQKDAVEIGRIKGEEKVCADTKSMRYEIEPVAGATTYTWTVPAGWTIESGQNTNAITLTAGTKAGVLSVTAANSCVVSLASTLDLTLNPRPAGPAEIKDLSKSCAGLAYAVDPINGVLSYTWEVPVGWSVTSGQGTPNITVTAPAGATAATLSVVTNTASCSSLPATLQVEPSKANAALTVTNVFSPNGDGVNDKWEIASLENYSENDLTVFNRWGNEVYRQKNYQNTWNGGELSAGTYFYVLQVKECDGAFRTYKGYVMIMR